VPSTGEEEVRLNFVTDALYGDHLRGVGHPESPDRVEVVASRLRDLGKLDRTIPAGDATDAEMARVHAPEYIELVKREIGALHGPRYLSTGDVVVDERSLDVARRAAGGAIAAVRSAAASGEATFALVRPPGHHAESARGMGFCLFNNAAIAARDYLAERGGRVLVVDFDYHHGNGTQAVAGSGISYVSTHAVPAYPGTGKESFRTNGDVVVNVALPVTGVGTEAFVAIWEELLPRVAAAVRPDFLTISAGFDYVAGDPVGDLGVGIEAAGALAAVINATAARHCAGRVAYVLEGGYDLDALTASIATIAAVTDARDVAASGAERRAIPAALRATVARAVAIL
jgi:acetoin utilization deacetylase AcuC-like enzyme